MKDKRIPEGPYFVTADDAEDTIDHRHSGLAKVDTGRSGDWPIARLCEWPTAHLIASIPEMQETIDGLREALKGTKLYCPEHVQEQANAALAAAEKVRK